MDEKESVSSERPFKGTYNLGKIMLDFCCLDDSREFFTPFWPCCNLFLNTWNFLNIDYFLYMVKGTCNLEVYHIYMFSSSQKM